LALLQRKSFINQVMYRRIPPSARSAVLPVAGFAFRQLHALQHKAVPLRTDLSSEKIIVARHGFVCHTIPKAGSSSLIALLEPMGGRVVSACVDELLRQAPETVGLAAFAIVRNPWARAVSAWRDKLVNVSNLGKLRILTRYRGLQPGMSFPAFVAWLEGPEGSDEFADRHWVSQWRLLSDTDVVSPVQQYGRLESMDADVRRILSGFGIEVPEVAHQNRRKAGGLSDWHDYYTPELKRAIARRYARDIEVFGYAF
jgi:chondroitin 4-sulfotransferase 11